MARRVAARLNKKLATGKARGAVASLDQIGSFQSFALWARRNHVTTTSAFDASVSSQLCPVVPTWVPGVRPRESTSASQMQNAIDTRVMIEM